MCEDDLEDPEDDEVCFCIECGEITIRDYSDICADCWIAFSLAAIVQAAYS